MKKKLLTFVLIAALAVPSIGAINVYANTSNLENEQIFEVTEDIKKIELTADMEQLNEVGAKDNSKTANILLATETDEVKTEVDSPEVRATFSISGSIGTNSYIKSGTTFYVNPGVDKLKIKSLSWSPTGQHVQLGFVNKTNGKQYWTSNYSGGSGSGTVSTSNLPAGEYYVAIGTPSTNNTRVNVVGNFDF